jgi:hypothetical protein
MRYLLILALFISANAGAQCKSFIISPKGDTLNCVDMKGQKQGPWVVRVEDQRGERGYEEEGYYRDGHKEGTWRRYSLQGDLIALENYRWGFLDGRNVYFNYVGELVREESWRAIDPQNPYDTVDVLDPNDPSRVIRKEIVKITSVSVKHGLWKYYDPFRGTIERTEQWHMDKPKNARADAGEDDLAPIDVTAEKKPATKPKEVLEFEKKNSGKKKVKLRDGSTGG